ncbi:MAG: hypothetical protein OHK0046_05020 [Anaerolineae bacterium]
MADFDDLRGLTDEDDDDSFSFDDIPDDNVLPSAEAGRSKRFLGMTALERMLLSIFLFMNVLVLGVALLLATGRIG